MKTVNIFATQTPPFITGPTVFSSNFNNNKKKWKNIKQINTFHRDKGFRLTTMINGKRVANLKLQTQKLKMFSGCS